MTAPSADAAHTAFLFAEMQNDFALAALSGIGR